MGLLSSIGKGIAKVLDTTTVALAHPIQTITAVVSPKTTVNDVIEKHFSQPLSKKITQTVVGTAGIAATVASLGATGVLGSAAAASKPAQIAASAAKAIIPTTTKGKIIAAAVAPIAITAAVENPKKVIEAPSKILNFQENVGTLIANPSLENLKTTVKENPLISGGVIAGAVTAVGLGTASLVSSVMNTQAVKENTALEKEALSKQTVPITLPYAPSAMVEEVKPITPAQPSTIAQTKTISNVTTPKKRSKKYLKKYQGIISQRVNVIVSNRSSSMGIRGTRYINDKVYN